MDTREAIRHLVQVDYKGWMLVFEEGAPGMVTVRCEFWADNSTPRHLDERDRVIAESSFGLRVNDVDDVFELHHRCLEALIRNAETHESREFYKVNGRAPFHPHTIDGEARWNRRRRESVPA
jgi:hypothetical protein